ncbi:sulfotransferase [Nocardioides sp.]|uniref:sulfotransferase family protein n=1 Tax=Nocardioides sp. TaxID=35761 RepID=UPI0031FED9B3
MPTPRPLFVVGLGRSGTTAILDVFAAHPEIVLGVERFKGLWGDLDQMGPELFVRERFFDFEDGLTNLRPQDARRWRDHYARMADKWESARYVGDKMTTIRIQKIWRRHPEARFVCIVRDIEQVAHSWHERASNVDDLTWPDSYNARLAVERQNTGLGRIRRARRQRPDLVAVVEHSRFFGDPEGKSLLRVLDWLDLDPTPEIAHAFDAAHAGYVSSIAGKARPLPVEDAAFIDRHADSGLWRDVTEMAM